MLAHQSGVRLLRDVSERLRVPNDCRELADVVAREHGNIHRSASLGAAALVRLLERCDAFRKPQRFRQILLACECDARGRAGRAGEPYPQAQRLQQAEHAPPGKRGQYTSWIQASVAGGFLLAVICVLATRKLMTPEDFNAWGWRVPFIASAVLTVLGIALRRSLAAEKVERATGSPLREAFTGYWRQMLAIALANISTAIVSFVAFMFAVPWIERNSEPDTVMALMANLVGLVTTCATSLIGGRLGDHLGRRRIALLGLAELVLVAWPAFMLMLSGNFLLMALGSALLGVGQGLFTGAFCAMMVTLLPRRVRVTGMAFSYSLATGAAGGLAPMLAEYLVDRAGIVMAPALVVMVAAALSLAVIALHPMWRHNDESLPEDHKAAGGISSPTRDIGAVGFSFRRAAAEGGGQRIRE